MAELNLWFLKSEEVVELERTLFIGHPDVSEIAAVRGKSAGAYKHAGTFEWSSGVKALSALCLTAVAHNLQQAQQHKPLLVGKRKSLAASLDYALNKKPAWMFDMFGADLKGNTYLRQLLHRTNAGLKRIGTIQFSLNERLLPFQSIKIFVGECQVNNAAEIEDLITCIVRAYESSLGQAPNITVQQNTHLTSSMSAFPLTLAKTAASPSVTDNEQHQYKNNEDSTITNSAPAVYLKGPIKIGLLAAVSGVTANLGAGFINGFRLYLDQINHTMGRRKVSLIAEDDECDYALALEKVTKLTKEKNIHVLTSASLSHITYGILRAVNHYELPTITSSGADDITKRQSNKWMIRTAQSASVTAHASADWFFKNLGYRRIVTLGADYIYGHEVIGAFAHTFGLLGGQIIQKLWAPLGFRNFSSIVKQISKDADALFLCTVGQQSEIIYKLYYDEGIKLPIIGAEAGFDEEIYNNVGDSIIGATSTIGYSTSLSTPSNKAFVKSYTSSFGTRPSIYSENGYVAAMCIHKSVEAVAGDIENKEAFLDALKRTELFDTPHGTLKLDNFASSIQDIYIQRAEKVNFQVQNVVIDKVENVSQFWKYDSKEYLKQAPYSKAVKEEKINKYS